jgi:hypothetical protein
MFYYYLHGVQGGARASHALGAQGSGAAFSQAAGFAFSQTGGVHGCGSAFSQAAGAAFSHAFGSAFSQGAGAAFSHAFGSAFSQGAGAAFSHAFGVTFSHALGGVIFSHGATAFSAFSHAFGVAFSQGATGSQGPHGVHDRSFLPRIRSSKVRDGFFTLHTGSHGSQAAGSHGGTATASACSQGLTCWHGSQSPAKAKEPAKHTSERNKAGNMIFFDILSLLTWVLGLRCGAFAQH